jgi:hypothetical protein
MVFGERRAGDANCQHNVSVVRGDDGGAGAKMKKILLATVGLMAMGLSSASAADLAVKAPYAVPSPVWDWTGFCLIISKGCPRASRETGPFYCHRSASGNW